jgi:iron complex transport system substrate-binding protein
VGIDKRIKLPRRLYWVSRIKLPTAARGALLALSLIAAYPAPSSAAISIQDDLGRVVILAQHPRRILSLAPGATEMLFAAGAGDRVIATVDYSDDPPAARRVPRIGDANSIDMERLIALHADVVVVWPEGGNPAQIAQVERMGLPIYREQVDAFSEFPASLRRLGELAGTSVAADRAARDLEVHLAELHKRYGSGPTVTVLLEIWDRPIYTVGGRHLMSDALNLCGAKNVFSDLNVAAPVVDVEAVIARNPDMIIAAAPPHAAAGWLDEWRPFGALQAVRSGRLIPYEDQRLSGLGPSALLATAALCELIDAKRPAR